MKTIKNYHKDGCEMTNNAGGGHTYLRGCEKYTTKTGVISVPSKDKGFILAELKIHLLSEFSDAELSRLVIWLKEISNTITKDKGHTTDVYSLKLIK